MPPDAGTRYDTDFYAWTHEQAAALRDGPTHALDRAHLAEEIDILGASEKRALGSHLKVLLTHLLKWRYEPSHRQAGHSWADTIDDAREQIADVLETSPSLATILPRLLPVQYGRARKKASHEMQGRMPLQELPEVCPWTLAEVRDDDFFPEGEPQALP